MPFPIGVWFWPPELFPEAKGRGCNFVLGPELGNPPRMTGGQWAALAAAQGLDVVGNFDARPPNLLAWFVPIDEPNGHGRAVADLKPFVDRFLAIDAAYPTPRPILISLAGDKISNDDAGATADWYRQVAALAPGRIIFLVNFYQANRNADRYKDLHLNKKIVARLRGWAPMATVWVAVECSNQYLPSAKGVGREPTADEMEGELQDGWDGGAIGVVWFATAPSGPFGWPGNYNPPTAPEIPARQRAIAARLNPVPAVEQRLAKLEQWAQGVTDDLTAKTKLITRLQEKMRAAGAQLAPDSLPLPPAG